jgi:hypothetical protein
MSEMIAVGPLQEFRLSYNFRPDPNAECTESCAFEITLKATLAESKDLPQQML